MANQGYAVGLARALFWVYPRTGLQAGAMSGQNAALANGSGSGAYVMSNVKTAGLAYAPITDVQIQGGDRIVAAPMFGNPRLIPFDIIASDIDDTLVTLVQGSATNNTNTFLSKFSYNSNKATPNAIGLAVQQRFELTTGLSAFVTRVIPKAIATYHPGVMGWRAESDTTIHISGITGTISYTGQPYATAGLAFQDEQDRVDYYDIVSSDPVFFYAFKGDGAATSIPLPYRALNTTVTINASPNELVIFDTTGTATVTALSAITTGASPTATTAAATVAGSYYILTYTTNFIP